MAPQAWLLEAADHQLPPGCRAHAPPWDAEPCAEAGSVGGTGSGVWPVHAEQNHGRSPHTPALLALHEHQGAGRSAEPRKGPVLLSGPQGVCGGGGDNWLFGVLIVSRPYRPGWGPGLQGQPAGEALGALLPRLRPRARSPMPGVRGVKQAATRVPWWLGGGPEEKLECGWRAEAFQSTKAARVGRGEGGPKPTLQRGPQGPRPSSWPIS